MITATVSIITALQAQAEANHFLLTHLADRFVADDPIWDAPAQAWRVPVLLAYPFIGLVGRTGEILVGVTARIVSHTPLAEMKAAARLLYEQHRDEIEAPLP